MKATPRIKLVFPKGTRPKGNVKWQEGREEIFGGVVHVQWQSVARKYEAWTVKGSMDVVHVRLSGYAGTLDMYVILGGGRIEAKPTPPPIHTPSLPMSSLSGASGGGVARALRALLKTIIHNIR